jgi:hypothetical protein
MTISSIWIVRHIQILISLLQNYSHVVNVLGAIPKFPPHLMEFMGYKGHRVANLVSIGGRQVPVDIRFVGDGYMDSSWMSEIIFNRVKMKNRDLFIANATDGYYSLLYHALVHKPHMHATYADHLESISKDDQRKSILGGRKSQCKLLVAFMDSRGYTFTTAHDPSVKCRPCEFKIRDH